MYNQINFDFLKDPDSDNELLKKVRECNTNKESCLYSFNYAINLIIESVLQHFFCPQKLDLVKKILNDSINTNVDIIFKYSESPIEQIFLNSLLTHFLPPSANNYLDATLSFLPLFTHPMTNTNKQLEEITEAYEESVEICNRGDINETIDNLNGLFNKQVIDLKLLKSFQDFLFQHQSNNFRYKTYHFTMQSVFPDLKVDGKPIRTDILIWKPNDKNFKLIVECDGFQFHSGKKSFTNDRKRDRLLQTKGFDVFRFSGSEIYHEPFKASLELFNYLKSKE